MSKQDDDDKRSYGMRSVAALVPKIARPVFQKRSPASAQLLADWDEIVGPELASVTYAKRFAACKSLPPGRTTPAQNRTAERGHQDPNQATRPPRATRASPPAAAHRSRTPETSPAPHSRPPAPPAGRTRSPQPPPPCTPRSPAAPAALPDPAGTRPPPPRPARRHAGCERARNTLTRPRLIKPPPAAPRPRRQPRGSGLRRLHSTV